MSEKKTPLEQALDLFVYAPLGLVLTAREELPRLVEKGREQVHDQATTARLMGEFALQEGRRDLGERAKKVTDTFSGVAGTRRPAAPAPPAAPSAPVAPSPNIPAPAPVVPAAPTGPRPSDDGLAIPGYDALSASQVVQRLAGLSAEELEAVRAYESATRGRKTILHRVDQLQIRPCRLGGRGGRPPGDRGRPRPVGGAVPRRHRREGSGPRRGGVRVAGGSAEPVEDSLKAALEDPAQRSGSEPSTTWPSATRSAGVEELRDGRPARCHRRHLRRARGRAASASARR